jgi:predicted RNA binding protein YcfA (HicA-like mRNA interferase family)
MASLYDQLRAILLAQGCVFVRQGKGSHEIWQNPGGQTASVPVTLASRHTANAILKQLGIAAKI